MEKKTFQTKPEISGLYEEKQNKNKQYLVPIVLW